MIAFLFVGYLTKTNLFITSPFISVDPVAVVNGEAITREMVERELKISRLNVLQPLSPLSGNDLEQALEEAHNQLINRRLILQAATRQGFKVDDVFIEQRLNLLFGGYGDEALDKALKQSQATRADLFWWVAEITTVENFSIEVIMADVSPENRQQVYNSWLNEQQATAEIKIYKADSVTSLSAMVGQAAPNFSLNTLEGHSISLHDYEGKVVLLNFWATWCPSCTAELPTYQAIYQEYGSTGDFVILGINLQENRDQVEQFTTALGLTFPILLDNTGDVTIKQYHIAGMPGSILINRNGIILYRHIGPMPAELLKTKLKEIAKLQGAGCRVAGFQTMHHTIHYLPTANTNYHLSSIIYQLKFKRSSKWFYLMS